MGTPRYTRDEIERAADRVRQRMPAGACMTMGARDTVRWATGLLVCELSRSSYSEIPMGIEQGEERRLAA